MRAIGLLLLVLGAQVGFTLAVIDEVRAAGPCAALGSCSGGRYHREPYASETWFTAPTLPPSVYIQFDSGDFHRMMGDGLRRFAALDLAIPLDRITTDVLEERNFELQWVDVQRIRDQPNRRSNAPVAHAGFFTEDAFDPCRITSGFVRFAWNPTDDVSAMCWVRDDCGDCVTATCDRNNYDWLSAWMHEYGHILGLIHSSAINATMQGAIYPGDTTGQTLLACEGEYLVKEYRDNGAAAVSGFAAVREGGGITVQWMAEESQTSHYLIERAAEWGGPFDLMASLPAIGAPSYRVAFPGAESGVFRLREVEVDGDTLPQAMDRDREPYSIPPFALALGDIDSTCAALLAGKPKSLAPLAGEPEYFIFAPDAFANPARFLRDVWRDYQGVAAEVVALEELGGPANIKPYLQTHLASGGYALLFADGNENHSVDGRPMRLDPSLYVNGFIRDSWPDQGHLNIIPSFYTVETDSQHVSLSYFTPFRASDWWYVDFDNDGRPEPGYFVGRAPASDTTEAWAFVWKTVAGMWQDPYTSVGLWSYAHDAFGNDGAHAVNLLEGLRDDLGDYVLAQTIYDTPASPLTGPQRDALAKAALDAGRSLVAVISTTSQRYHLGGFLSRNRGVDVNSLQPHADRLTFFLGISCDLGDFDRTENDSIGPPLLCPEPRSVRHLRRKPWNLAGGRLSNRTGVPAAALRRYSA